MHNVRYSTVYLYGLTTFQICPEVFSACADQEVGQVVRTPPEKSQNIGFLSKSGPDPLKITKLPR